MSGSPSWPQLAGWLATAYPPACRGAFRTENADEPPQEARFAYRPPGEWRVELPDERVVLAAPRQPSVVVRGGGVERGSPLLNELQTLFRSRSRGSDRGDFHLPIEAVEAVSVAGRLGWRVVLEAPGHKYGPLEYVVDDEHGFLLRTRNLHPSRTYSIELVELQEAYLGDEEFQHLGHSVESFRNAEQQRLAREQEVAATAPLLRWTPFGLDASFDSVDEETGTVEVRIRPPVNGSHSATEVRLVQSASEVPEPPTREGHFHYRWAADGLHYLLDVERLALTAGQLRKVQESLVHRRYR